MSEKEIYERFIKWLNQSWWGLPDAPEVFSLIRARYSPEEAEFLTGMPFSGKDLAELAAMKKMDSSEMAVRLDALAKKGLVLRMARGNKVSYGLNDSLFVFLRSAFWAGSKDEISRTLAPLTNQYFYHGFFDGYAGVSTRGLRTVPVNAAIEDPRLVLPYEDMAKILDRQDYFTVSICPCKHRKNLDPAAPNCTHPTEVCLHFGRLGHYLVENGLGREITRREAEEILRQSAESGLVHGLSNRQEEVDTLCNCCKCCCIWFESYHILKHAKSMDASNYRARIHTQTCKGCGLCAKRCPMEAIKLEASLEAGNNVGKAAVLDSERCIGCGVCAYKCPSKSIVLERREVISDPPADPRDYMKRFLTERGNQRSP